ncbi:MAG: phosphoribosylformylglycinamidine cyclo-ligase [Candidatus Parcubacteria bacterium]|jgi:phosphoribosylformylglycinamidine cyclo-ligase|nr:phosphoribosylformylglycinamidine cyclo-ligase [Candidatus Parcubacteria bacterium]
MSRTKQNRRPAAQKSLYALAGVDYTQLEPFKEAMIAAGKKTSAFPNRRGVYINEDVLHSHGGVFEYRGNLPHIWCQTQEGLGNKNWIAEWMYMHEGTGKTYYQNIAIDTALMAANDCIAQGAMPVIFTDEVAVGDSAWFSDKKRSRDLVEGFVSVCREVGMALPAGESPALRYLIKSEHPVKSAPSLSGCVTGIIAPKTRMITGRNLRAGDHIIGASSSGLHANGISLVIKRALELPDKFLTKLPNGNALGAEALIPTRSYVALIEALLEAEVEIHALLPGTGDGVGKIAFDKREFRYRIHSWVEKVPELFRYYREAIGLPLVDCLKTFNWGIGYYIFAPATAVRSVLAIGRKAGYDLIDAGIVEKGERSVIFEPENITLAPPGQ